MTSNKNNPANLNAKASAQARLAIPSVIVLRLFLVVSILLFAVSWFSGVVVVSSSKWYGPAPLEGKAQLRAIKRRLSRGEAEAMGKMFPEGRLFSYSFYGFCLVNMALSIPEDHQFRVMAIEEIEKLLANIGALFSDANRNDVLDGDDLVIHAGPQPLHYSYLKEGNFDGHVVILRP